MRFQESKFNNRWGRRTWRGSRSILRNGRSSKTQRELARKCSELRINLDETRNALHLAESERDDIRIKSEELESQVSHLRSELRRAHSDVQRNKRQVAEKEKQATDKARIEVARRVMTVADEFKKAIEMAEEQSMDQKWFDGFKAMAEKIDNCLLAAGYRRFESIGEDMDPSRHEALATKPTPDESVGKVIQVVAAGYEDAETSQVVRVAKVLVGRRESES